MICLTAMCLRQLHSLHSFARHPFRYVSFLYTSLHYFLAASFRSFQPPQHRSQEQLFQSFKENSRNVPFRCPFRFPYALCCNASQNLQHRLSLIGTRTASLHAEQFFSFLQSPHLSLPPHGRIVVQFISPCDIFTPAVPGIPIRIGESTSKPSQYSTAKQYRTNTQPLMEVKGFTLPNPS